MRPNASLFLKELLLYASTVAIGIFAAWRHVMRATPSPLPPLDVTPGNILLMVAVFIIFLLIILRLRRVGRWVLHLTLAGAMFMGTRFVAAAFVQPPLDIVAGTISALGALAAIRGIPMVLPHDLAIMFGIAGISALLGASLTPTVAAVLLAVLSLYDIYAVFRSRHMVAMADRMIESGAVFGFLIPMHWRDLFLTGHQAMKGERVMLLGSGDVGLPLVLAASAVSTSLGAALGAGLGSLLGLGVMHWLFISGKGRAMAALPPVAAGAIIGYLVATLLGV